MNGLISENFKLVKGIVPSADVNNGDPASDVINMGKCAKVLCICHQNSTGGTGTSVITVEACDDITPTTTEAIAFTSRKLVDGLADTLSTITSTAAAGVTTLAGKDEVHFLEVNSRDLPDGKPYLRVQLTEGVNAPVVGSVFFVLDSYIKSDEIPTVLT